MVEPQSERDSSTVVGVVDVVLELLFLLDKVCFEARCFEASRLGDIFPEGDDGVTAARGKDVVIVADGERPDLARLVYV